MDWTQFVDDEPAPTPAPAPDPTVGPPAPNPWDAFVEDPLTAARRGVGTAARDRLNAYLKDPSEKLRANRYGWDPGTIQRLQNDADDEEIAESHLVRALSPPPAPAAVRQPAVNGLPPSATPEPPPMAEPSTPDGIGGYLRGAFPGTAATIDRLGAGVESGAAGLARGAAGALDAVRVPLAPGMTRADALADIDASAANADRQVVGSGRVAKTAVDLAPWFLPGGQVLGAAAAGGNRRLDVLDRFTGGDPTAATARDEALADTAGAVDAGVSLAAPKLGGAAIDATLGQAGKAALQRGLGAAGGRIAESALHGAAGGEALAAGAAGVSAATGDYERAKDELASIGLQALVGGGLGAGGRALGEFARGGRQATPEAPGGVDENAQTQTDLRPVGDPGSPPRMRDDFVTESGSTEPDLRARIAEEDARGFERVRAAARARARFRADPAAETLPEVDPALMPEPSDHPTEPDRSLSESERALVNRRSIPVEEGDGDTVGDNPPITFPTPPPREVRDFLAEHGVDWNVDLEKANGRSRPLLNRGTRDVRPEFTDTATRPADVPIIQPEGVPARMTDPSSTPETVSVGSAPAARVRSQASGEAQEARQAAPEQRADDVVERGSAAPPEANQRATSARPDLAIPSAETPTREAFKSVDQLRTDAGKPEPVRDADVAKAAGERLTADFHGEHAKIAKKLEDGQLLDQHETVMHQRIIEKLVNDGRTEDAAREINAYRIAGGDAARAFRTRADPTEPPIRRVQRAVVERVLEAPAAERREIEKARGRGDQAAARKLADQAAKNARGRVEKIKQLTGIDPHDLAGEKGPKLTSGERVQQKIKKASIHIDREFADLKKRLRDVWKSSGTSVGSTGGEAVDILSKMITNRIKRGLLTAADVAVAMARQLPELRKDVRLQRAFKAAWNASQREKIAGDPAEMFARTPEELLKGAESRLEAAQRERDRVASLTPGERLAELKAKRGQKKNVPEDVQALRDQAAALRSEIADRDAEILPPERKAGEPKAEKPEPTIDERLASARERLARAAEKHLAAMGQTDAERLASVKAKAEAKEPLHPEVQALHDMATELSRQVSARDRKVYLNALRVQDADRTVKASAWDMEDELWRNGLHTSLMLPEIKVTSDVANRLLSLVTDDIGRAVLNLAPGGKDTASLADLPHIAAGLVPSLRLGLKMGWDSLLNDRNVFSDEVRAARAAKDGDLGAGGEFHQGHALPRWAHNVTGWNLRAVGALQAAAEAFFARLHVGADAYRLAFDAQGQRLAGPALEQHMREQLADIASPAWTAAIEGARYDTGVSPPPKGSLNAWISKVKRMEPETAGQRALQFTVRKLAPFNVLPINYLVRGVYHMTPLNTFTPVYRSLRSLTGLALGRDGMTYSRAQFNADAARSLLAWASTLTIASVMDDEKGKPRLTGYGTYEPSDVDLPTDPKHSIRIGDRWHDYTRALGPFGHSIGLMVDFLRNAKATRPRLGGGEPLPAADAAKQMLATVKEHVTDEAWLRSVHDFANAFESEGSGAKYVGTFASSYVPTFIKQAAKAKETDIQNSRVHAPGFSARVGQSFEHNIGVPSADMVDIFGKPIAKDDPVQSVSSYVSRLLNPVNGPLVVRDDAQPFRDMIQRWNDLNPTAKAKFPTPAARLEIGGKQVPMTDQQYHDLLVDAGTQTFEAVKDAARRGEFNTEKPTADDMALLREIVKRSQAAARLSAKAQAIEEGRAQPTRLRGAVAR